MKQPPQDNRERNQQQSEYLVAPVHAPLLDATSFLGHLLGIRLDARFHHAPV